MYKQPIGYSSTYHRHLALAAPIGQLTTPVIGDAKADQVKPVNKAEEVIIPSGNGPESREQPMADQQSNESLYPPSRNSNRKSHHPGLIQPASVDRRGGGAFPAL